MRRWIVAAVLLPMGLGAAHALVNVNTAQQSELQLTKGLDRHKAKAIIEYRAQNGNFATLEDLAKVPGLDKQTVERIAPEVAFAGPSYVPPPKPEPKAKAKKS